MDLYQELTRLVAELEARELPYGLVGALALAVHGVPRATTDIDLLVRPEHVDAILDVARGMGFIHEAFPMVFGDGLEIRRITRVEGSESLTLDLILVQDNLEPIWSAIGTIRTDAGSLRVVSREALIRMKVAAGRPQDVADIARLQDMDR